MELLLLGAALTAITLAGVALSDLLAEPVPWRRKAGWILLIIGLPVIGPMLYFRRSGGKGRRRRGRRKAP